MANVESIQEQFLQQGLYLRNWSTRTVRTYRQGLATLPSTLSKASLAGWVVAQRQRGVSVGGVNMYARTINSYLSWLHEEGHTTERLKIKLLPNPAKTIKTFSDGDIRLILAFTPKGKFQLRTWSLIVCLLDTGVRIEEALTLQREKARRAAMRHTPSAHDEWTPCVGDWAYRV
jgi:site-specific recombinase XerD